MRCSLKRKRPRIIALYDSNGVETPRRALIVELLAWPEADCNSINLRAAMGFIIQRALRDVQNNERSRNSRRTLMAQTRLIESGRTGLADQV